jgi:hypothetical protein
MVAAPHRGWTSQDGVRWEQDPGSRRLAPARELVGVQDADTSAAGEGSALHAEHMSEARERR